MRTRGALSADDGYHAEILSAVTITVLVFNRLHLVGMTSDFNPVPLTSFEVADHVIAKAFHPMVMNGAVFTGDAGPIDRSIGIDVPGR